MQSILPWIGIVILFLTGWAVVKKYQVNMVLLLGGLALNILAVAGGLTTFLPKNAAATGFVGFDFMELLRAISRTQIAGVGFIILVSGGFAEYMKAIGASDRFVTVCAKPLSLIKNPYLILAAVFIFGLLGTHHYVGSGPGHADGRDGLSLDHPRRLLEPCRGSCGCKCAGNRLCAGLRCGGDGS